MTNETSAFEIEYTPLNPNNPIESGRLDLQYLGLETTVRSIGGQGAKRVRNEDGYILPSEEVKEAKESIKAGGLLYAVADGVGGVEKGEKAAERALEETQLEYYENRTRKPQALREALKNAANKAHQVVRNQRKFEGQSMATTFVGAIIEPNTEPKHRPTVEFACVGDSRGYILSNTVLEQITKDSLWYDDMLALGGDQAKQARKAVAANPRLLAAPRTIGGLTDSNVEVDFFGPVHLKQGDIVLLCTDGLYNALQEPLSILQQVLVSNRNNLSQAADALLGLVQQNPTYDDVTFILIKVARIGKLAWYEDWYQRLRNSAFFTPLLIISVLLAIIVLFAQCLSVAIPNVTPTSTATVTNTTVPTETYTPSPIVIKVTLIPSETTTITPINTSTPPVTATATSTFTPTLPPSSTFIYQIHVQNESNGEVIVGAKVVLSSVDMAPEDGFTNLEGFVLFQLSNNQTGQLGTISVEAEGYQVYQKDVNLIRQGPEIILLEPLAPIPTATSIHSQTPTNTPTFTPTPIVISTPTFTPPFGCGDNSIRCTHPLPPNLIAPPNYTTLESSGLFEWSELPLKDDEYYDLQIYKDRSQPPIGVYPTRNESYLLDFGQIVDDEGREYCNDYIWLVRVGIGTFQIANEGVEVTDFEGYSSPPSEEWVFIRNCSGGGDGNGGSNGGTHVATPTIPPDP